MSPVMRMASSGFFGVERVELVEHLFDTLVAARTRSAALDAKAVALADDVEVRQDEPLAIVRRPGGAA